MDEKAFSRRVERRTERLTSRLESAVEEEEQRAEADGEEQLVWLVSALHASILFTAVRSWALVLGSLKLHPDTVAAKAILDRTFSELLTFAHTQIEQELKSSGEQVAVWPPAWRWGKGGRA